MFVLSRWRLSGNTWPLSTRVPAPAQYPIFTGRARSYTLRGDTHRPDEKFARCDLALGLLEESERCYYPFTVHTTAQRSPGRRSYSSIPRRKRRNTFGERGKLERYPKTRTTATVTLPPPTPDQQLAIHHMKAGGCNLIISAMAGSGKTTTILHIAQAMPDTNFLILVYNTRLMNDTAERAERLGLTNVTIMNYHTLGSIYYTRECSTDQGLKRIVQDDMPVRPGTTLPEFSVLVMDEQQDMTPIMKNFVMKILRDSGVVKPRLLLLGDPRQELYGFNNADRRFLTLADRKDIFGSVNKLPWKRATQSTSNRVTQPAVDFLNQQMFKKPEMRAVRATKPDGNPYARPRYVVCDPAKGAYAEVRRLLDTPGLSATDVIVLAPSVRIYSAALLLANELALNDIPVHRSDSDHSEVAPEVAKGKVLVCTYHQAKGIERKAAIVFGIDMQYYTIYKRDSKIPTSVDNAQYVALTRASEYLTIIHDKEYAALPFVDVDTLHETCDVVGAVPRTGQAQKSKPPPATMAVTALVRNLSEDLLTRCLQHVKVTQVQAPLSPIIPSAPTEVRDKFGLLESVSAITGTAIPLWFYFRRYRKLTSINMIQECVRKDSNNPLGLPARYLAAWDEVARRFDDGTVTISDMLYVAALEMYRRDGDLTKLLALPLDGYTWLERVYRDKVMYRIGTLSRPARINGYGLRFEKRVSYNLLDDKGSSDASGKITISGDMDIYRKDDTGDTIWELKHTETFQPQNVLQLALYMLLVGRPCTGYLVSSMTGQVEQVEPRDSGSSVTMLRLLVASKTGKDKSGLLEGCPDQEFCEQSGRGFEDLVRPCALPASFAGQREA